VRNLSLKNGISCVGRLFH